MDRSSHYLAVTDMYKSIERYCHNVKQGAEELEQGAEEQVNREQGAGGITLHNYVEQGARSRELYSKKWGRGSHYLAMTNMYKSIDRDCHNVEQGTDARIQTDCRNHRTNKRTLLKPHLTFNYPCKSKY